MRRQSAEPAQSVLDRASTVLPLPCEVLALHHRVSRGYRPALFRLIIGGRSLCSSEESRANPGASIAGPGRGRQAAGLTCQPFRLVSVVGRLEAVSFHIAVEPMTM